MAAAPQDEASRVTLEAWLVTDVGVVREHNEDAAYMEPANGFFIVADGMSGHAAGEVASAMAVDTVRKTLENARKEIDLFKRGPSDVGRRSIVQLLQNAVLSAHQAVFQRGQQEADKAGMGTTLDVVLIAGPEAFVAHVGDSRTYLVRDGRSSQITTDHTVAEVLVIEGKLTIEEAQVSPLRTILVNAIGVSADVGVEMAHVTLKRGDRLLLCSDGLHDYFPIEDEIAQKLSTDAPGDALKAMVELAKTRGGHDNITGVAVQVTEVVEAVPGQLDGEMTQPVDVPVANNPFASDEPTETAVLDAQGEPRVTTPGAGGGEAGERTETASSLRATQPMRNLDDDEPAAGDEPPRLPEPPPPGATSLSETTLDTEPVAPAGAAAAPEPSAADTDGMRAGDGSTEGAASGDGIAPATAPKAEAAADASEGKPGARTEARPGARPEGKPEGKAESNNDAKPAARGDGDAVPGDLATADTGRISVSGKKHDAG
ncbi:MAG: serine/threonine-protein phosphatase [Deltaproteobacteria bacterium]|nr:MAG: serine/threonine-protein phosphatase [Deltaproteobacteria bacterium]